MEKEQEKARDAFRPWYETEPCEKKEQEQLQTAVPFSERVSQAEEKFQQKSTGRGGPCWAGTV